MDSYDLWHILNEPIQMDSLLLTLADVGDIKKSRTGIDIRRENRVYQVDVCFDYVGSAQSEQRIIGELVNRFNQEVLPVGYKAQWGNASWFDEHKEDYLWLILLIVAIIYVSLSMSLNSVKLPIAIISLIPVSFIGLFLVFGYSHYPFDQGGFAALVMLSGIVVNSGIYLVTSYRQLCPSRPSVSLFIKAFRFKIRPILLTVASTVLGLLPFFSDGPGEVFWFEFALGTISGLLFSLIALVFLLPLLILVRRKR
jgi:multidrug efflux pump subunit AcrB